MSLADTTDFGLLRLIVNDAALGKEKLTEAGFSSLLSCVSIIEIPHISGSLQSLLKALDEGGVNIEYMYGLSAESSAAYVVLKASDPTLADKILEANGIRTLDNDALAHL